MKHDGKERKKGRRTASPSPRDLWKTNNCQSCQSPRSLADVLYSVHYLYLIYYGRGAHTVSARVGEGARHAHISYCIVNGRKNQRQKSKRNVLKKRVSFPFIYLLCFRLYRVLYYYNRIIVIRDVRKIVHGGIRETYYASTAFPPRLAPPLKRPRLMPPTRAQHPKLQKQQSTANTGTIPDLNQLKVYSNPDILICGNCREMFTELGELLEHKRNYCKLRFTCKCHTFNGAAPRDSTTALLCVLCKLSFPSAWELMVHAQAAHMINIYELGTRAPSPSRSPSLDQPKESSPSPQDFQEIKATDCEERAEEEELDGHELIPSPDSGKSTDNEAALSPIKIRSDVNGLDHEDCDELIHVENTAQACIMHTLSIDSSLELNSDTNTRATSGTVMALTNGSLSAKE
ncbi:hypothetical protein P5V15_010492 [Pogonomyrmex californicus]